MQVRIANMNCQSSGSSRTTTVQEVIAAWRPFREGENFPTQLSKSKRGRLPSQWNVDSRAEYDLPYRAAVMVMPEYPGNPTTKFALSFTGGTSRRRRSPF
jgi:hypothetical protein